MAEEQVIVEERQRILGALSKTTAKLRQKLGESLATIQRFDTPIEQATTPSLDALEAYSMGRQALWGRNDPPAAVPFLQRALHLDPNFAMARAVLATSYYDLGENALGTESAKRAYNLRDKVSERERFYIESYYYDLATGDLEKARQVYEIWARTYPRDWVPLVALGVIYDNLGQYEKSLTVGQEAMRLDPEDTLNWANTLDCYMYLNRWDSAKAEVEEARKKKLDSTDMHGASYLLAFLRGDAAGMEREVSWSANKPGIEDVLLAYEADSAAYLGQLKRAREFSDKAVFSAKQAQETETAGGYEADAALREALFGNHNQARQRIAAASRLSAGQSVQFGVALALALVCETARPKTLADALTREFPEDTIVQFNYLPTVRAELSLCARDPRKALDILRIAHRYELGISGGGAFAPALYGPYVRGKAYLAAHMPTEAAGEFQEIIDFPGVVANEPIGALAHLELARACALKGDLTKARTAYQTFLSLWKSADPDIPIFKQAKAEYAKLQ